MNNALHFFPFRFKITWVKTAYTLVKYHFRITALFNACLKSKENCSSSLYGKN